MSGLLCDYSDSSADEEEEASREASSVVSTATTTVLPSAEDLFASDTTSVRVNQPSTTTSYATKRTFAAHGISSSNGSSNHTEPAKRLKTNASIASGISRQQVQNPVPKMSQHFAPPQLKRPNVSTEDRGAWNSQKTIALQQRAKAKAASSANS